MSDFQGFKSGFRKSEAFETLSEFPPELLQEIMVRLPPEDLIRCLCVSKAWNAFICQRRFIKAHLQRSIETNSTRSILFQHLGTSSKEELVSLALNDNDTVGVDAVKMELPLERPFLWGCSVHGLVCISSNNGREVALWNPSIRKLKKIPSPNFELRSPIFGFGYDSVNDDYKVVGFARHGKISKLDNNKSIFEVLSCEVKVYSLKSNSWKVTQTVPSYGRPSTRFDDKVNLNGGLSWMMPRSSDYHKIGTLDLATEEFREFFTPVHRHADDCAILKVLGGCLCISVSYSDIRDLWIMKEYGVAESWSLLCSIDQGAMPYLSLSYTTILASSKNGEMVLFSVPLIKDPMLLWYDVEKKIVKPVQVRDLRRVCNSTVCVGSLCLLDDGDSASCYVNSCSFSRLCL